MYNHTNHYISKPGDFRIFTYVLIAKTKNHRFAGDSLFKSYSLTYFDTTFCSEVR